MGKSQHQLTPECGKVRGSCLGRRQRQGYQHLPFMVLEIRPGRIAPGFSISCQGGEDCISKGPKTIRLKSHLHLGNRTAELSPAAGQGRGERIPSSGPLIFLSHHFHMRFQSRKPGLDWLMTAITNLAPSFHLLLKGSRGRSENLRCQTCSLGFFFSPLCKGF